MQWNSRIDPDTNQVVVGIRNIIVTIVAVMVIAFADDIKSLIIDVEKSGVMESNTRQNIETIYNIVTKNESLIDSHAERILKLEFINGEQSKLQRQISMNTNLIRKMQNSQIRMIEKINNITSNSRKLDLRVRSIERK